MESDEQKISRRQDWNIMVSPHAKSAENLLRTIKLSRPILPRNLKGTTKKLFSRL